MLILSLARCLMSSLSMTSVPGSLYCYLPGSSLVAIYQGRLVATSRFALPSLSRSSTVASKLVLAIVSKAVLAFNPLSPGETSLIMQASRSFFERNPLVVILTTKTVDAKKTMPIPLLDALKKVFGHPRTQTLTQKQPVVAF